jgi:hypothetical protein
MVFTRQIRFSELLLRVITEHSSLQSHEVLTGCFHVDFVEEIDATTQFWTNTKNILVHLATNIHLHNRTRFHEAIPTIAWHISEFLLLLFQFDAARADSWIADRFEPFSALEAMGLVFLASSKRDVRSFGVSLLASLIEMVRTSQAFGICDLPCDEYQALVIEARSLPTLTTGHSVLKNILRVIPIVTEGSRQAWDKLFDYFCLLSHKLNPKVQLLTGFEKTTVDLPVSELTDEWIGCSSILFALKAPQQNNDRLFEVALGLLDDQGDLGAYTVATIPSAIHVNNMMPFVKLIATKITDAKPAFVRNCLKIVRGMTDQKYWTPEMIDVASFGKLTYHFVVVSDQSSGKDAHLTCAQYVVSVENLMNKHQKSFDAKTRQRMAEILLGWFSRATKPTKQFISAIRAALALTLDDLSLVDCTDPTDPRTPQEQATAIFMLYFATIKARVEASDSASAMEFMPVLAALLKQNLGLGIEECVSMGFADRFSVRAVFIAAVASVFKVPEAKVVDPEEPTEQTLLDILFAEGFAQLEFVIPLIPFSRNEPFANALVEGAIYSGVEMEFLGRMIDIELATIQPSTKNTLFRGNTVPPRAVSHYSRFVGTQWMTDTLLPFFEEVIENCQKKKIRYEIDPHKMTAEDDITKNRENLRAIFEKAIDVISGARKTMPVGLVRESQLLYHKVYEKYGDFSSQILSGFIFLRFLLPAFTCPKMVGMTAPFPEQARSALLQVSTMLMMATLKGNLDDKGKHMSDHFNDLAARAQKEFNGMFSAIVNCDIGAPGSPIALDPNDIITRVQAELWPSLKALTEAKDLLDDSDPLLPNLTRLIQKVRFMGTPAGSEQPATSSLGSSRDASRQNALLTMKLPERILAQLADFIVREGKSPLDGSMIYVVNSAVLSVVTDSIYAPYLIFRQLNEEPSNLVTLVFALGGFDETKVPNAAMVRSLAELSIAKKVTQVLCIEPNDSFAAFVQRNPQLLERANHFTFVRDLAELAAAAGSVLKTLPPSALESLSKPDSSFKTIVNGRERTVRLHQRSVHFAGNVETIHGYEIAPVTVIMTHDILKFVRPHGSGSKRNFSFLTTDGTTYTINANKQIASLYESLVPLTRRNKNLIASANVSRVRIDTSTLQWLMLNLGFINMVNEEVGPIVRKSALDLIYAVFATFNFPHDVQITKSPIEILPANLLGFVTVLSEDVARYNSESYYGFISEFFTAYRYVEPHCKPVTFHFLRPWIQPWAADIENHMELLDVFISLYKGMPNEHLAFSVNIWSEILKVPKGLVTLNQHILNSRDEQLVDLAASLGLLDPINVGSFWFGVFEGCATAKRDNVVFVSTVLAALLAAHACDHGSALGGLIHNVTKLRLIYDESTLMTCWCLFENLLHTLIRLSDISLQANYAVMYLAFYSSSSLEDFLGAGKKRFWLDLTIVFASVLRAATTSEALSDDLFERFSRDLQSPSPAVTSSAFVFAAALAGAKATRFAEMAIQQLLSSPDERTLATMSYALSALLMSRELAGQLFYLSCCLVLFSHSAAPLPLMASAVRQYGSDRNILSAVSPTLVKRLCDVSGLDFAKDAVYSALLLLCVWAEPNEEATVSEFLASGTGDPLAKVFGLLVRTDKLTEVKELDFGDKFGTVAAVVLNLLRLMPKPDLVHYAIHLCETRPAVFAGINAVRGRFGEEFIAAVGNATLVALLASTVPKESTYQVANVMLPVFDPEKQHVGILQETLKSLTQTLFN